MNIQIQLLNTVTPLAICALAILPFIIFPSLRQKDEEIKQIIYNSIFCYLLCLGFIMIGLITTEAALVMGSHSSARALFITAILSVACLDKAIDLLPQTIFIKANLIKRLTYFVSILCVVPMVWQMFMALIPEFLASNLKFMSAVQITLIIILLALGVVNRPIRKPIT